MVKIKRYLIYKTKKGGICGATKLGKTQLTYILPKTRKEFKKRFRKFKIVYAKSKVNALKNKYLK